MSDDRVTSGAAWRDFCDRLRDAGEGILRGPADPLTRAEGFRYISRLARAGLETFVEHDEPLAPVLMRVVHETVKMGADNPDNFYQNACLSGRHRYRLHGQRNTVRYLGFATQVGAYGQGRGMPPTGHLDGKDLVLAADGSFTIDLATSRPDGATNFLPITDGAATLIVRQTRLDPAKETLAALRIERLGERIPPAPLTPEKLDAGLQSAGMIVAGASMIFAGWAEGFQKHVNTLPRFDPAISLAFGGVPDIAYYHSYWRLGPDEALVIDATPPPVDHWNFQLDNHWMESLDYRHFRIHVNSATARYREGGAVRVVVAHRDPGVPNWIETAGHTFGTMCWRWVRPATETPPDPQCRIVPLADVASLA